MPLADLFILNTNFHEFIIKIKGDTPLNPNSVLFFGAKKRTKRNIHLTQALPYMEGM